MVECKGHLGLGGYQGGDFDRQIADCTLCFLTYKVVSLDKRFSEYETMGALFAERRDDLMEMMIYDQKTDEGCRVMEA